MLGLPRGDGSMLGTVRCSTKSVDLRYDFTVFPSLMCLVSVPVVRLYGSTTCEGVGTLDFFDHEEKSRRNVGPRESAAVGPHVQHHIGKLHGFFEACSSGQSSLDPLPSSLSHPVLSNEPFGRCEVPKKYSSLSLIYFWTRRSEENCCSCRGHRPSHSQNGDGR